jgi:HK97 family phage major capsid protein
MFTLKSIADQEAMTSEELQAYKTAEKAHDKAQILAEAKAEVKKEVDTQKARIDELEGQIVDLSASKTKEDETELIKFFKENAEKFKETNKQHTAQSTIKAAALMTTANVVPNAANGFSPLFGNYIDNEVGQTPKPDLCILPLITIKNQPGTENIYHSSRYNEEGDAQFILEGGLKPLADAEWKTDKAPVKEVAVRWKFTKRLMNHAPSVVGDFAEHANELMEQKMDDGALIGDGVDEELLGITAIGVAGAFVVPTQLSEYYERANIYDAIMAVATRVRLSNFKGQLTAVLNTVWEAKMKGIKNADGDYIVPPFVSPDGTKVGSVNVVFNNKFPDTHLLVGDLKRFNLVMSENVTYDEGYENDDFSKNLVSKKLEAFMGTYIKRADAGSIIYDDIAGILTDIETP